MEVENDKKKFTSLKYTTEFKLPPYNNKTLYNAAIDYKKSVNTFNNEMVGYETITKKGIIIDEKDKLIKDVFTPSGKFLSKRNLIWVNEKITYADFKSYFYNSQTKELVFSEKTTNNMIKSIYNKYGISVDREVIGGKKVLLYIPKSLNSKLVLGKKLTIESSSAPIELIQTKEIIIGEDFVDADKNVFKNLIRTNVYNVDLFGADSKDVETNGANIKVIRQGSDITTWIKNTYYKKNEKNQHKKMGWKKTIIDFPLYDKRLIDIYSSEEIIGNNVDEAIIEVTIPIIVTLEDILTNVKLAQFKEWLYDNVNLFNISIMRILKNSGVSLGSQGEAIISLISKNDMETSEERKNVNHLSKTMSLYLGLKKKMITIMRKIRRLTEAFSIKNLNDILKSIQSFNDKKLHLTKNQKSGDVKRKIQGKPLTVNDLNNYCTSSNLAIIKKYLGQNNSSNPILGQNITIQLSSPENIKRTVKELFKILEEGKEMDHKTFYDIIDVEAVQEIIDNNVVENDNEERLGTYDKITDDLTEVENAFKNKLVTDGISTFAEDFEQYPWYTPNEFFGKLLDYLEAAGVGLFKKYINFVKNQFPSKRTSFRSYSDEDIELFLKENAYAILYGKSEDLHDDLFFLATNFVSIKVVSLGVEEITIMNSNSKNDRETNLYQVSDLFSSILNFRSKMNLFTANVFLQYEQFLNVIFDAYYILTGKNLKIGEELAQFDKVEFKVLMNKIAISLNLKLNENLKNELESLFAEEGYKDLDIFLKNITFFTYVLDNIMVTNVFDILSLDELWKNNAGGRKEKQEKNVKEKINFNNPKVDLRLLAEDLIRSGELDSDMGTATSTPQTKKLYRGG